MNIISASTIAPSSIGAGSLNSVSNFRHNAQSRRTAAPRHQSQAPGVIANSDGDTFQPSSATATNNYKVYQASGQMQANSRMARSRAS
ncbi:MAG: hypothetical protein M0Z55_13590 [Peptococcaceae bacterium]|nr:hypothetical protein [Peptococcaceae bacterium]